MSCNGCLVKFNFFHKEMGCANCGIAFCSKCLKQKWRMPNKGNLEVNVCKLCYSKLAAGTSATSNSLPPPDAYLNAEPSKTHISHFPDYDPDRSLTLLLRRLENLENPSAPPITIYQQNSKFQKLRMGLGPVDVQILERLERLRENRSKIIAPSESEIRNRLASLKGENPYVEEPKKPFAVDTRTDKQKADALLEQFVSEREIELAHNPQEDIEARIACLRERGVRPNENSFMSSLHDSSSSEDELDKITKKIMDEVALDERCSQDLNDTEMKSESPELPWCVLCNHDASLRCEDCDGDLYCQSCSAQVHQNCDADHRLTPFTPRTNI